MSLKSLLFIFLTLSTLVACQITPPDTEDVMKERQIGLKELKQKVLPQMAKESFDSYPVEPIGSWKTEDCAPKGAVKNAKRTSNDR